MAERKSSQTSARKSTKSADDSTSVSFTDEEKAAMKEYAQELKTAARRGSKATREDGESDLLAKIAEMSEPDRSLAERVHHIVTATAPELAPRTWYGMPAYSKDGNVLCFFQPAQKFKARYSTLGFSDKANLDEGNMWPNSYALTDMSDAVEARIVALIKQAVS